MNLHELPSLAASAVKAELKIQREDFARKVVHALGQVQTVLFFQGRFMNLVQEALECRDHVRRGVGGREARRCESVVLRRKARVATRYKEASFFCLVSDARDVRLIPSCTVLGCSCAQKSVVE